MRFRAILLATATTGVLLAVAATATLEAQERTPELTFMFPQDGDVFGEPLPVIQMCFAEPINNKDLDKGGDFKFTLSPPNNLPGLGMRIVFQPDGQGLAIYPGVFEDVPDGEWTFEYRVTDADTLTPLEGFVHYEVREGGNPPLQPTPAACTAASTPAPEVTQPPDDSDATPPPTEERNGDGPDVLMLALFTIGAAGLAGVVALIGYVIRNRVGFWLHRPPERRDGDSGKHH